jgi:biotin operon repressor
MASKEDIMAEIRNKTGISLGELAAKVGMSETDLAISIIALRGDGKTIPQLLYDQARRALGRHT